MAVNVLGFPFSVVTLLWTFVYTFRSVLLSMSPLLILKAKEFENYFSTECVIHCFFWQG